MDHPFFFGVTILSPRGRAELNLGFSESCPGCVFISTLLLSPYHSSFCWNPPVKPKIHDMRRKRIFFRVSGSKINKKPSAGATESAAEQTLNSPTHPFPNRAVLSSIPSVFLRIITMVKLSSMDGLVSGVCRRRNWRAASRSSRFHFPLIPGRTPFQHPPPPLHKRNFSSKNSVSLSFADRFCVWLFPEVLLNSLHGFLSSSSSSSTTTTQLRMHSRRNGMHPRPSGRKWTAARN